MHLTRRMRLIWHKLWLIPLVGATADVVASEAAKLGGVTVQLPWLFSAIGVAGMLGAAVARAYSVPLIPEGLETPDEALTRRSRVLGERLGATPVRVFVSDLPKLRGKVDTFIDGHDLFVSERVAELPEAERDFVLALALVGRGPAGTLQRWVLNWGGVMAALYAIVMSVDMALSDLRIRELAIGRGSVLLLGFGLIGFKIIAMRKLGLRSESWPVLALEATGNLAAAKAALLALAACPQGEGLAVENGNALEVWWNNTGKKAVEASEWYQRERSLAAKAE